jgi:hypothetical protein
MPLTTLDPVTALIVIDLQKGIVSSPFIHPIDDVVKRSRALIDTFRTQRLPVVLVNVAGAAPGRTEQPPRQRILPEGWTDLIPELGHQPGDIVVTKRTWGAFASTNLEARLKAKGVTQVVVTGVATGTGVEATARRAPDHSELRHGHLRLRQLFPRLGVAVAEELLHKLLIDHGNRRAIQRVLHFEAVARTGHRDRSSRRRV